MSDLKIILDLCGGTGAWSQPYSDAGYDVRIITLPKFNVLTYSPPQNVYGILAAPPCTMFSLARTTAKTPRDFYIGMKPVEACLRIIWTCRKHPDSRLRFWALENPRCILRRFLGKPAFTFSPEDFGDRYTKKTDLWGYFNEPTKNPVNLNQREILPPINYLTGDSDQRSITPPHFALAFFKANQ